MSKIQIFSKTLTGKFKKNSQDFFLYSWIGEKQVMVAIADGVGAHQQSQIASKLVCQVLKDNFSKINLTTYGDDAILSWFKENVLPKMKQKLANYPEKVATTLTFVLFLTKKFYLFHIGDTRFYQFNRKKNTFFQLTQDHISTINLNDTLSWLKGKKYLKNAISNYNNCYVDFHSLSLVPGYFLLTTDGLHDFVSLSFMHQVLKNDKLEEEVKIETLFNQALVSGSLDDITCLLLRLE